MSRGVLGAAMGTVLSRECERIALQIEAYPDEASVWKLEGSIKNSPGTLALHVVGNLEAYVGATLGDTGYVRDRDAEFGDRDVPRAEITRRLRTTAQMLRDTLGTVSDATLLAPYPGTLPGRFEGISSMEFLTHLTWHIGWHEGQIDYHRRILFGGDAI